MTARFAFSATPLAGVWRLDRKPIGDERGWLERVFCAAELGELLGGRQIAQVNRTLTHAKGTVRGMHYQRPPAAETKIVSCLRGAVFDVTIDVRRGSPTFLAWHGELLTAGNRRSLFVPEGFAHGFQALEDESEVLYLTTAPWSADTEAAVHALDPRVAITWPLAVSRLSARDASHPPITPAFDGIAL